MGQPRHVKAWLESRVLQVRQEFVEHEHTITFILTRFLFSVSIYGSLDPNYQIPELGISLKEAFEGKLLIVLDDTFSPLAGSIAKMEPSRMLPNGPQVRHSVDYSTRIDL